MGIWKWEVGNSQNFSIFSKKLNCTPRNEKWDSNKNSHFQSFPLSLAHTGEKLPVSLSSRKGVSLSLSLSLCLHFSSFRLSRLLWVCWSFRADFAELAFHSSMIATLAAVLFPISQRLVNNLCTAHRDIFSSPYIYYKVQKCLLKDWVG